MSFYITKERLIYYIIDFKDYCYCRAIVTKGMSHLIYQKLLSNYVLKLC